MENTDELLTGDDRPIWYYTVGDTWYGPLRASDMYKKVLARELTWAHYVWRKGQAGWKRMCDLRAFRSAAPEPPEKSVLQQIKEIMGPRKPAATRSKKSAPPSFSSRRRHEWFLFYNHTQFGPFSIQELLDRITAGKLHGRVLAWRTGMDNWVPLGKIDAFRSILEKMKPSAVKKKHPRKTEQRGAARRPIVARILMAHSEVLNLGICRDISIGGMQVLCEKVPGKVGDVLPINVSPSGGSVFHPFTAKGEIVRILEDGRGFSFRFMELDKNASESIRQFIG